MSAVREGDYFMLRAGRHGIEVDYAPTAPENAPLVGAFASIRGRTKFWDARKAAHLLEQHGRAFEEALAREVEIRPGEIGPEEPLSARVLAALQAFAGGGYAMTAQNPVWDGRVTEFQRDILYPALGEALTEAKLARALRKAGEMCPGIEVAKTGKEWFVTLRWAQIAP